MIKIKIEEKRNLNFIFKVAITNDDISNDRILKRLLMEGKKIRGEYTYEIPLRFLLPILNNYNKDNIEIDNINNLIRIELCGQGLWDYESLNFYYNDGKIKSINLYTSEKSYYIDEYLYSNTFNYDDMFKLSIFISLTTIIVTICVKIKRKNL